MTGDIDRERTAIEGHLRWTEANRGKREAKRQRDIVDYLEGFFSEAQIRQFYALYLWGKSWRADYDKVPPETQTYAESVRYEEALITLVANWRKFKKADHA